MAKGIFKQAGNCIDYTNSGSTAIVFGDVVPLTDCIGVAASDIAVGDLGALELVGVYELPAATAALTNGQKVYWDATNSNVTATATDNTPCGVTIAAKASGVLAVDVKIG
ncbi:MAG: DUF2190 family protein [Candidatus Fimivivens sp.]|nr:DUF2190 family protein [Candidatus Fimivivens sp.]